MTNGKVIEGTTYYNYAELKVRVVESCAALQTSRALALVKQAMLQHLLQAEAEVDVLPLKNQIVMTRKVASSLVGDGPDDIGRWVAAVSLRQETDEPWSLANIVFAKCLPQADDKEDVKFFRDHGHQGVFCDEWMKQFSRSGERGGRH